MQPKDLDEVWALAAANGYQIGICEAQDSLQDLNKHIPNVKRDQDQITSPCFKWWKGKIKNKEKQDLPEDALKYFFRFYVEQSTERINKYASAESIKSQAEFFAGFTRVTGTLTLEEQRREICWMAEQWNTHKDEIGQLYLKQNMTVGQIVKFMEKEHNFKRSKPQYERQLKSWGFRKNLKGAEWRAARRAIESRPSSKPTNVYIAGNLIDLSKAQRKLTRYTTPPRLVKESQGDGRDCDQVYAFTPPDSSYNMIPLLQNLPWIRFHGLIESNSNPDLLLVDAATYTAKFLRGNSGQLESPHISLLSSDSTFSAPDTSLLPSKNFSIWDQQQEVDRIYKQLRAVFPDRTGALTWARPGTGLIKMNGIAPQFSILVYLASNNFVRMKGFDDLLENLLDIIEHQMDRQTFKSLFSNKDPTIQALLDLVTRTAIRLQNLQLAKIALDSGGHPGENPFESAIVRDNKRMARLLIDAGVDLDVRFENYISLGAISYALHLSPLEFAALDGKTDIFHLLVNAKTSHSFGEGAVYALYKATERGETIIVKALLSAGVRDDPGIYRKTALEAAIEKGHRELIVLLADSGAILNYPVGVIKEPLEAAAEEGSIDIVKFLLDRGAYINGSPNRRTGKTALQMAALKGNMELVKFLIAAGADIHAAAAPSDGMTALQAAASNGHFAIVEFLLDAGKNANFSRADAATDMLEIAIKYDAFNIDFLVRDAIVRGKGINEDIDGDMLFQRMNTGWFNSNTKFVQTLLSAGADVGKSPINCLKAAAARMRHTNIDIINLLLDYGVLTTAGQKGLVEALCFAIDNHDALVIERLLEFLTEPDWESKATLLHQAVKDWYYIAEGVFSHYAVNTNAVSRILIDARLLLDTEADLEAILNQKNCYSHFGALREISGQWNRPEFGGGVPRRTLHFFTKYCNQPVIMDRYRRALQAAEIRWKNDSDLILQQLVRVLGTDSPRGVKNTGIYGMALQRACLQSDVVTVRYLLNAGADANNTSSCIQENFEATALQAAASALNCRMDLIHLLLDAGAEINSPARGYNRRTVLVAAISHPSYNPELLRLLIDAGANVNDVSGTQTALQAALSRYNCDTELVRLLIQTGANVNAPPGHSVNIDFDDNYFPPGKTRNALQLAVCHATHSLELTKILLDAGAKIEPAENGPLLLAVADRRDPNLELVRTLLAAGADVNAPAAGFKGRTALQAAVERNMPYNDVYSAELVEILLAAGADIHAPAAEDGGVTALQAAAMRGFVGLAVRFLEMGADVNAPRAQESGRTALEIAAEWGRIDMVKLLLDAGAVLGEPGFDYLKKKWFNAMSLAKDRGFRAVYNQIRDHFGLSDAEAEDGFDRSPPPPPRFLSDEDSEDDYQDSTDAESQVDQSPENVFGAVEHATPAVPEFDEAQDGGLNFEEMQITLDNDGSGIVDDFGQFAFHQDEADVGDFGPIPGENDRPWGFRDSFVQDFDDEDQLWGFINFPDQTAG
ncbi:ankyrin [Stipitochalara longipes BDJ]|nr:ankyrin [Stipitochalara longipes BDJ]